MSDRDFLVFVEEDDDGGEDAIVLDVPSTRALSLTDYDFHPEVEVQVENQSSNVTFAGLVLGLLGAIVGLASIVAFVMTYPNQWYTNGELATDTTGPWFTVLLGVVSFILLLLATFLTQYGRRLNARGVLRAVHVTHRG